MDTTNRNQESQITLDPLASIQALAQTSLGTGTGVACFRGFLFCCKAPFGGRLPEAPGNWMKNCASFEMFSLGRFLIDCLAVLDPCPIGLECWSSGKVISRPIEHD